MRKQGFKKARYIAQVLSAIKCQAQDSNPCLFFFHILCYLLIFLFFIYIVKLVSIQHPVLIPTGALLNAYHPPSPPSQPPGLLQPSVCSQYLRISYGLPPSLSVTFSPLPLPAVLLLSFSGSTYEWTHVCLNPMWFPLYDAFSVFAPHTHDIPCKGEFTRSIRKTTSKAGVFRSVCLYQIHVCPLRSNSQFIIWHWVSKT